MEFLPCRTVGWNSANKPIKVGRNGPVAQRLEQATHNRLVPGSNPGGPTNSSFLRNVGLCFFPSCFDRIHFSVEGQCVNLSIEVLRKT